MKSIEQEIEHFGDHSNYDDIEIELQDIVQNNRASIPNETSRSLRLLQYLKSITQPRFMDLSFQTQIDTTIIDPWKGRFRDASLERQFFEASIEQRLKRKIKSSLYALLFIVINFLLPLAIGDVVTTWKVITNCSQIILVVVYIGSLRVMSGQLTLRKLALIEGTLGFIYFTVVYLELWVHWKYFSIFAVTLPRTLALILLFGFGIEPSLSTFAATLVFWSICARVLSVIRNPVQPTHEWQNIVLSLLIELKTGAIAGLVMYRSSIASKLEFSSRLEIVPRGAEPTDSKKKLVTSFLVPFVFDIFFELGMTLIAMWNTGKGLQGVFIVKLTLLTLACATLLSTTSIARNSEKLVQSVLSGMTAFVCVAVVLSSAVESYGFLYEATINSHTCIQATPTDPITIVLFQNLSLSVARLPGYAVLLAISGLSLLSYTTSMVAICGIHSLVFYQYIVPLSDQWCPDHLIQTSYIFYNGMFFTLLACVSTTFLQGRRG